MGAGGSALSANVRSHVAREYERLKQEGRNYLVLAELRNLQSIEDLPIDMQHLGTVFVLDSDRNGRVTLSELFEFAALCSRKRDNFRQHDYPMQLQGFCTLRMLDTVLNEGMDLFVRWFQALFTEGYEECFLPEYPNVAFVGRDTAHLMYEVLHIDDVYGYDMQSFFDLLQRAGEEIGIMSIEDERLDELVPKLVVEKFAKSFGEGFINLLHNELKLR